MDRRKRVELTLQRQKADRVPRGELLIDDAVVGAFLGVEDVGHAHRVEFADRMDLDLICLQTRYGAEERRERLPSPGECGWRDIDLWCSGTDRFVFVMLDGGFSWGLKLLGFLGFMTSVMRGSTEVESLLHGVDALNSALMERAAGEGAHGIVIADDIAYSAGPLIAPGVLRDVFFPPVARQAEWAHGLGLRAVFHSDGDLNSIMDDLAATGVDGLQCLEQAAGMDLGKTRKLYGNRLCLWGNLDPALLTAPLDPHELERQVSDILDVADLGGVIFGTSSGLFKGMRAEGLHCLNRLLSSRSI